jgi:hypothetical protein
MQKRSKSGVNFEKVLCDRLGLTRVNVSPKIHWNGTGKSNIEKIHSLGMDPKEFYPVNEKSFFGKWDTVNESGEKYEIKKYKIGECIKPKLYSEPIVKICHKPSLEKAIKFLGGGDYELSVINYNHFIRELHDNIGEEILNNITRSNNGIYFIDGFVPSENINFEWVIKKNVWKGYDRLSIMFNVEN